MNVGSRSRRLPSDEMPPPDATDRTIGTDLVDPLGRPKLPTLLVAGIVLAGSTPISGFVSYALLAVLFGESRLEGPDALMAAGYVAFGLPLLLGIGLILFSVWNPWSPSRQRLTAVCAVAAVVFLTVGLWSAISSGAAGDASIGGGLLVLASIPTGIVAIVLGWSQRSSE